MKVGGSLFTAQILAALAAIALPAPASAADRARITGLTDVAFGMVNVTADQSASQSVCAFSNSNTNGYSVMATGSGSGGAFELSGASPLPYEVLWADAPNQTGGTLLLAGGVTTGFNSSASQQTCNSGPPASASLTIVLRAAALSSATAGTYSGALQVTIAPE